MLACTLEATNTGNVRLTGLALHGDASECTYDSLAPNSTVTCRVFKALSTEQLWHRGSADLHVPYNVTPRGMMAFLEVLPPSNFSVDLSTVPGFSPAPPVRSLAVLNSTAAPVAVYTSGE